MSLLLLAQAQNPSSWQETPSLDSGSSCPSLLSTVKTWWLLSMPPGQQGHSWVLSWLSCSLLNAQLAGFTSLWLSFSILSEELGLGLGSKERSQRERAKPPRVVQSGLWELPRGRRGRHFQLAPLLPSWLSLGCSFYLCPKGAQIKG